MNACRYRAGAALVLILAASSSGLAQKRRTTDREQIIDVAALKEAMQNATAPVSERIKSSRLDERFAEVRALLAEEDLDKPELLRALGDLHHAMDGFVSEWNQVTDPLWEAQDTIAGTIDRVRATMAGGFGVEENQRFKELVDNYDKRLDQLALQTLEQTDPQRRARLKRVYANVLSLRGLTQRVTALNLSPAADAMHLRIIRALSGLQEQLTLATYEVERMRVVLAGLSSFVGNYVEILTGLVEAEKLAQFWAEWNKGESGLGTLVGDVDSLISTTEEFVSLMDGVVVELADSIESETARMSVSSEGPADIVEEDVDADILKRTGRAPDPADAQAGQ